jgi:hypothetical protein
MIPLKRFYYLPCVVLLAMLAAGCTSSSSSTSAAPPATTSAAAAPATVPPGNGGPTGADTYLAIGQDVRGTHVLRPSCAAGCVLSGDSTVLLWHMTWQTWTGAAAVGTGTEELVDCTPSCAAGKQYHVAVQVTFSQPVKVCVNGGQWFWTRASFVWPHGLPSVFTGDNAPLNPWDFTTIKSQSSPSCG